LSTGWLPFAYSEAESYYIWPTVCLYSPCW